ncbi:hypothetical protein Ocin01_14722 [Orchesella cincta]|uniref:Uncharacterized protein n=1 Tax=Orchesella cincta TaxID=48709 RepID=A0A1D2MG40_ORCCI|nr:hypothetical protein Ocin01_14722 [Orchesella cincta]
MKMGLENSAVNIKFCKIRLAVKTDTPTVTSGFYHRLAPCRSKCRSPILNAYDGFVLIWLLARPAHEEQEQRTPRLQCFNILFTIECNTNLTNITCNTSDQMSEKHHLQYMENYKAHFKIAFVFTKNEKRNHNGQHVSNALLHVASKCPLLSLNSMDVVILRDDDDCESG